MGTTWTAISPDLSKNDKSKQGDAGGLILKENTVAEYYGTVCAARRADGDRDGGATGGCYREADQSAVASAWAACARSAGKEAERDVARSNAVPDAVT